MNNQCDRSATIVRFMGRGLACPADARAVVLHKIRGNVAARLCSQHISAYRDSGIPVTVTE